MKPLVSVIVPVYKVEPWLERCLDSLVNQTLKEIEIIVIDDGSPDRCGEICDAYAVKDSRFRVVHQENRGLSAARNVGIELAQADYLMFVDSDDWVDPEFCRLPYEAAVEHGADIVIFQYERVRGTAHKIIPENTAEGMKTKDEAIWMLFHGLGVTVWNKLYHRILFSVNRFPVGRLCEDLAITHRTIYEAERVFYRNVPLYYHQARENSITQVRSHKLIKDRYELIMQECRDLECWGYTEEALRERQKASYRYLEAEGRNAQYSAECLSVLSDRRNTLKQFSKKRRLMLGLVRSMPPLFDVICIYRGKRIK